MAYTRQKISLRNKQGLGIPVTTQSKPSPEPIASTSSLPIPRSLKHIPGNYLDNTFTRQYLSQSHQKQPSAIAASSVSTVSPSPQPSALSFSPPDTRRHGSASTVPTSASSPPLSSSSSVSGGRNSRSTSQYPPSPIFKSMEEALLQWAPASALKRKFEDTLDPASLKLSSSKEPSLSGSQTHTVMPRKRIKTETLSPDLPPPSISNSYTKDVTSIIHIFLDHYLNDFDHNRPHLHGAYLPDAELTCTCQYGSQPSQPSTANSPQDIMQRLTRLPSDMKICPLDAEVRYKYEEVEEDIVEVSCETGFRLSPKENWNEEKCICKHEFTLLILRHQSTDWWPAQIKNHTLEIIFVSKA